MAQKVWTLDDFKPLVQYDVYNMWNAADSMPPKEYVEKLKTALGLLRDKDAEFAPIYNAMLSESNGAVTSVEIPLTAIVMKPRKGKVIAWRDHFFNQLVNLKNDTLLNYEYIDIKRMNSSPLVDVKIDEIDKANTLQLLKKAVQIVFRFIENEDRYRNTKYASQFKEDVRKIMEGVGVGGDQEGKAIEEYSLVFSSNFPTRKFLITKLRENYDSMVGGKSSTSVLEVIDPNEENNTKTLTKEEVEEELKREKYFEKRILKKIEDPDYGDIIQYINPFREWVIQEDEEFEETWLDAKKSWKIDQKNLKDSQKVTITKPPEITPTQPTIKPITTPPKTTKPQKPIDITKKSNVPKNVTQTSTEDSKDVRIRQLSDQVNKQEQEILRLEEQVKKQEKERIMTLADNVTEKDNLQKKILQLEVLNTSLNKGNSEAVIKQLEDENKELSQKIKALKEDNDGYTDDIEKLKDIISDLKKQSTSDDIFFNLQQQLKKYQSIDAIYINNAGNYIESKKERNKDNFFLVERDSLNSFIIIYQEVLHLEFSNMNGKTMRIEDTLGKLPQHLYNITDEDTEDELKNLVKIYQMKGIYGNFSSLRDQMESAILESHISQAYQGKDRMRLEFSKDGEPISEVTISSLSLQVLDSGERAYVVPMKDTESYEKVYTKIPLLGKNVISSEGRLTVKRSGYDPIEMAYRVDYDTLGEENLYYGKSFIFQQPSGIRIETNFINKKNHHLSSIVIPESLFNENKSFSFSALPAPIEIVVPEEKEIFEVPIYQTSNSFSASEEEEQEWPSDY